MAGQHQPITGPVQATYCTVQAPAPFPVEAHPVRQWDEAAVQAAVSEVAGRGFDLAAGPLLRVAVFSAADGWHHARRWRRSHNSFLGNAFR